MNKDLACLGTMVAHFLPGAWKLDSRPVDEDRQYLGVTIIKDSHYLIRLQDAGRMGKQGMIRVSGEITNFGLNWQEKRAAINAQTTSINVSYNRTPQAIADDIHRRLIPDYLVEVEKAKEDLNIYKQRIEMITVIEQAFKRVMPCLRGAGYNKRETSRRYHFYNKNYSGDLDIHNISSLSCDLKISGITPEKAIKIMALLSE